MNIKFKGVFTLKVSEIPLLPAREEDDTPENIKVNPQEIRMLMTKLGPPDSTSLFVFKEYLKTLV